MVEEVAIIHKDILARQAFKLMEQILVQSHMHIVVVGQGDDAICQGLTVCFESGGEWIEFADEIMHLTCSLVAHNHRCCTGAICTHPNIKQLWTKQQKAKEASLMRKKVKDKAAKKKNHAQNARKRKKPGRDLQGQNEIDQDFSHAPSEEQNQMLDQHGVLDLQSVHGSDKEWQMCPNQEGIACPICQSKGLALWH